MSQNFPDYYDGIVAGAPVYDSQAVGLSGLWADKAIEAIAPAPIQKLSDGSPILYPAFPEADQKLFTSALLAACADNTVFGYAYDGGFMAPTGIPAGKIGRRRRP